MNNPLLFWQQQNDLIDQRIRTFERKFFIVKKVEPAPEPETKPDGIIYERVKTRLTITEALRRINDAEIETPAPDAIRNVLYPGSGK